VRGSSGVVVDYSEPYFCAGSLVFQYKGGIGIWDGFTFAFPVNGRYPEKVFELNEGCIVSPAAGRVGIPPVVNQRSVEQVVRLGVIRRRGPCVKLKANGSSLHLDCTLAVGVLASLGQGKIS